MYNSMGRSNDNHVLVSESWGPSSGLPAAYISPRVRKIDPVYYSDDITQYNIVTNGVISSDADWTEYNGADTYDLTQYFIIGDGSAATFGAHNTTTVSISLAKVYAACEVKVTGVCQSVQITLRGSTGGEVTIDSQATPTAGTWYRLSGIQDAAGGSTGFIRINISATYADAAAASGAALYIRNVLADPLNLTYDTNDPPSVADYEADLPAALWFSKTNSTTSYHMNHPTCIWESPAYQIAPSAKKTLQYIWVTFNVLDATNLVISVCPTANGGTFTNAYSDSGVSLTTGHRVVKCKVKMSSVNGAPQKSDYVRIRIYGVGAIVVTNITLDWRIAGRAK
jgi:hypothetical protein